MVKNKTNIIIWIIFILAFVISTANTYYADKQLVVDLAGLLTVEEASKLQQDAYSLSEKHQLDIVIVTTSDTGGKSSRAFADDYFDYNGYGIGEERDGILLLLDFDNREAYISTSGMGISVFTDERIESVLDAIFNGGLTAGDNFGAANAFLKSTAYFLEQGVPKGQYSVPESIDNTLSLTDIILGFVIAGISGLSFYAINKSNYKGRPRAGAFEYRKNSMVNLGTMNDHLINTYVTTRTIPKVNTSSASSSGRSTVHRSSSGRSHGGGGRKF